MSSIQQHFDSQQLAQLVQQLQQQVFALHEQVQQHQNILGKMDMLEKENKELNEKLFQLSHENQKLRDRLSAQPLDSEKLPTPGIEPTTFAPQQKTLAQIIAKDPPNRISPARSLKRKQAAARTFRSPAAQGPQGFEYVYIGRSRKIQRSEVRSRLRHAGVDTGRVMDVCFPASGVIGILLHTQYVEEFKSIMTTVGAETFENFDPMEPSCLADPKFASWSQEERAAEVHALVRDRCNNTLRYLRPLTVGPVARYFVANGWICESDVSDALAHARERLAQAEPRKAAFLFRSKTSESPLGEDDTMSMGSQSEGSGLGL